MVEVECPSCTETVDLGSDSTGTYECPYCHEDFEYHSETDDENRDARLIDEIEYDGLKPDYVLQERRYLDSVASKIIPTIIAICFIPLFLSGLVLLWFIWKDGAITNHDSMTVFLKEQNLVLDYDLLNGEIDQSQSFELTDQSVIHALTTTNFDGDPSTHYTLQCKSTDQMLYFGQSFYTAEIAEFAEFIGVPVESSKK